MGLAEWALERKRSLNRALKKVQELEEGHPKSEEKMEHISLHGSYVMDQKLNPGKMVLCNSIQNTLKMPDAKGMKERDG